MRFKAYCVAAMVCMAGAALAADGIQPSVPFKVPFAVDGATAINRATFAVSADGAATLTVLYVKGDNIEEVVYSVARRDGPQPDPQPDPKPDPAPTPTELWGIVIEESANRTPAQAVVLASPTTRALFPDRCFQIFDPVNAGKAVPVPADLKPYVERAMKISTQWPVLFLVSPDGTIHYEGKLPESTDALSALIAERKGAK